MEFILPLLPPAVYLPVAVVVLVSSTVLRLVSKRNQALAPAASVVESISSKMISYERIDKAVELVLAKIGTPPALADWLGDAVADFMVRVPEFMRSVSTEQKLMAVADTFASTHSSADVQKVYHQLIPGDVASSHFAVKRLTAEVIRGNSELLKQLG